MQQTVIVDQLVGQVVGKQAQYRVERLLGQSRLNAVYLARNLSDQTMVALTLFITPEHFSLDAYQRFIQRFLAAAPALVALQHPHILPVHEFGEQCGYPYLITPYLTNGSLADRLRQQKRFSYEEVLEFLEQIAPALQLAHSRGLVHGTLKPANLVLDSRKQVLVAGFGLMHMLQLSGIVQSQQPFAHLLSVSETFLVAPEYLAPEVVEGRAIDKRSDVYALGCIIFELLSGAPPFKGDDPLAVAQMHVKQQMPSLHALVPDLPLALVSVVHQALERDPQRRFQQVSDVQEAFMQVVMGVTNPRQASIARKGLTGSVPARTAQDTPPEGYTPGMWQLTPPIVTGKLAALPSKPVGSNRQSSTGPVAAWQFSPPVTTGHLEAAPIKKENPVPPQASFSNKPAAQPRAERDVLPPVQSARASAPQGYQQEEREMREPRMNGSQGYQQDGREPRGGQGYQQDGREPRGGQGYQPDGREPRGGQGYQQDGREPRGGQGYQQDGREPRMNLVDDATAWWAGDQEAQAPLRLAQPDNIRNQKRKNAEMSNARSASKQPRSRGPQKSSSGINRRQVLAIAATGGVVAAGAFLATRLPLFHMGAQQATNTNPAMNTGQADKTNAQSMQSTSQKTAAAPPAKATQPAQKAGHTGTVVGSTTLMVNTAQNFTDPADGKASTLIHLPNGNFVAYKLACTHEGVTVAYDPGTKTLVCPAHGAIFDPAKNGAVLQGPATQPIPKVGVQVNSDGTVTAV